MALVQSGKTLTVAEVQAALGVKHPETARKVIEDLDGLGIGKLVKGGPGEPDLFRFRPDWDWCSFPDFRAVLLGEPVTNREVCADPITKDLVERQMEGGGGEEEGDTHTSPKMTGSAEAVEAANLNG